MGNNRLKEKPSCCQKIESFENFQPLVNSSSIENEPVSSNVLDEGLEERSTFNSSRRIISKTHTRQPEEKAAACCRTDVDPSTTQRKFLYETIKSLPARGSRTFPSSQSFVNSIYQKYKRSREGTYNVADPYSIPASGRLGEKEPYPYNVTYNPRTHVPRASRNYRTYENFQPNYFTTQASSDHERSAQFDRTRGQKINSMNRTTDQNLRPTYFSTPISTAHKGDLVLNQSLGSGRTPRGVRQETFTKQPTSFTRYARMVPTVDRLYTNPNLTRQVNPAAKQNYTFNYTQNPYNSPYKQMKTKISTALSEADNRTYSNQLEESAYANLADQQMPDTSLESQQYSSVRSPKLQRRQRQQEQSPYSQFDDRVDIIFDRPQSPKTETLNIQRLFPQVNTLYERPHSAGISMREPQLPACCRKGDQRPKTAGPYSEPIYLDRNQLPPCCRRGNERPKTANLPFVPKSNLNCFDNTCLKKNRSKKSEGFCNNSTCSEVQLVSNNTQTNFTQTNVGCQSGVTDSVGYYEGHDKNDIEGPLDTLLEIRTPHKVTGSSRGLPFVLSINVSCADKSVVVTPDKGYKSISSYQP